MSPGSRGREVECCCRSGIALRTASHARPGRPGKLPSVAFECIVDGPKHILLQVKLGFHTVVLGNQCTEVHDLLLCLGSRSTCPGQMILGLQQVVLASGQVGCRNIACLEASLVFGQRSVQLLARLSLSRERLLDGRQTGFHLPDGGPVHGCRFPTRASNPWKLGFVVVQVRGNSFDFHGGEATGSRCSFQRWGVVSGQDTRRCPQQGPLARHNCVVARQGLLAASASILCSHVAGVA